MTSKFSNTQRIRERLGLAFATAVMSLLAACASTPTEQNAATVAAAPKERIEPQTGSNLPRKANKPSNVVIVDPESVQGAMRGATRGSGSGP